MHGHRHVNVQHACVLRGTQYTTGMLSHRPLGALAIYGPFPWKVHKIMMSYDRQAVRSYIPRKGTNIAHRYRVLPVLVGSKWRTDRLRR